MVAQNRGDEVMSQSSGVVCLDLGQFRPRVRDVLFDWRLIHRRVNERVDFSNLKHRTMFELEQVLVSLRVPSRTVKDSRLQPDKERLLLFRQPSLLRCAPHTTSSGENTIARSLHSNPLLGPHKGIIILLLLKCLGGYH